MKLRAIVIATFLGVLTQLDAQLDNDDYAVPQNCTEVYSTVTSEYVPYSESYRTKDWFGRWKWQTRTNYKVENRTSYHERAACCDGYKSSVLGNRCLPVCESCGPHEVCSKPETCQCLSGYAMDRALNQCQPVCQDECLNGYCASPNSCLCNEGFSLNWDSKPRCVPVCNNCSSFEHCAEPQVCQCNNGYARMVIQGGEDGGGGEGARCEAVCDRECINSDCVEPNICKCRDGYEKLDDDDFKCEAKCTYRCINGECTSPNVCTCLAGYKLKANSSHSCEPICTERCINAECVAPGLCSCYDGYASLEDERSNNVCEPYCSPPCEHGRCSSPGNCSCDPGYESRDVGHVCEPKCTEACIMGNCTSPGTCTCLDNYRLKIGSKVECEPICRNECGQADCQAKDEYEKESATDSNSKCVIDCACENGYCGDMESQCQSCVEGYRLFSTNYSTICRPHCEGDCINGRCVQPELCICDESYIAGNDTQGNTICIPVCGGRQCVNGVCLEEDGNCDCLEGWSGQYCDEPLLCLIDVWRSDPVYAQLNESAEEENVTIAEASWPLCNDQCSSKINNLTKCVNQPNEDSDKFICLIAMDEQCKMRSDFKTDAIKSEVNVTTIVISCLLILLVLVITISGIFFIKKGRRLSHELKQSVQEEVPSHEELSLL